MLLVLLIGPLLQIYDCFNDDPVLDHDAILHTVDAILCIALSLVSSILFVWVKALFQLFRSPDEELLLHRRGDLLVRAVDLFDNSTSSSPHLDTSCRFQLSPCSVTSGAIAPFRFPGSAVIMARYPLALFGLLLCGCAPYKYHSAPLLPPSLAATLETRSLDDPALRE